MPTHSGDLDADTVRRAGPEAVNPGRCAMLENMENMPFVLAHQGGWDEVLLFAVPVALGWWAIKAAEKRFGRRAQDTAEQLDRSSADSSDVQSEGTNPHDR